MTENKYNLECSAWKRPVEYTSSYFLAFNEIIILKTFENILNRGKWYAGFDR
jgi:hypothetical protein